MQSVLTFELYGTTYVFDITTVIIVILEKIFKSAILLILCKNLKSLYDCLVKLAITQDK